MWHSQHKKGWGIDYCMCVCIAIVLMWVLMIRKPAWEKLHNSFPRLAQLVPNKCGGRRRRPMTVGNLFIIG